MRRKQLYALILSALLMMTALLPWSVLADNGDGTGESGESLVTMGADLNDEQRAKVYADFGIAEGSVPEIKVTNAEERAYLEGLVSEKKIGNAALSCLYITLLPEGEGLDITVKNINYCTEQMYINALQTAGIRDARVIISAPKTVSGTGALTGAYKAYETLTGKSLSDLAKSVGAEELVLTGELAEYIGSDEAAAIIRELKGILDQTQSMTDDEVRTEIRNIAQMYSVSVTDAQVDQVLALCRKFEGLDTDELQKQLTTLATTVQKAAEVKETASKVIGNVKNFFVSVGNFFTKLFGKKN